LDYQSVENEKRTDFQVHNWEYMNRGWTPTCGLQRAVQDDNHTGCGVTFVDMNIRKISYISALQKCLHKNMT
jgi:hypothetical protein